MATSFPSLDDPTNTRHKADKSEGDTHETLVAVGATLLGRAWPRRMSYSTVMMLGMPPDADDETAKPEPPPDREWARTELIKEGRKPTKDTDDSHFEKKD